MLVKIMKNDIELSERDIFIIWASYHNELIDLKPLINLKEDNTWNRSFVRSLASMIEGVAYRTRQSLITKYERKEISLTLEELIVLREKSIELDNQGSVLEKDKFYTFEKMFRFTFKTFAQKHNNASLFDNEFARLKETIIIRNRITHPKISADVFVSGEDVQIATSAFDWFHKFAINMFDGNLLMKKNDNAFSPVSKENAQF
jgi:hypothetical protein